MRYLQGFVWTFTAISATALNGGNGVCFHCEEIREYNKEHHKNYEYYEDYLKYAQNDQEEKQPEVAASFDQPKPPPAQRPSPKKHSKDLKDRQKAGKDQK